MASFQTRRVSATVTVDDTSSARSTTCGLGLQHRLNRFQSTASSSARALIAASRICAPRPKCSRGAERLFPAWFRRDSSAVKRQAESEGLDRIFIEAGLEWRDSGCSMCNGSNGELVGPGERCASTTNRNFEGRQGRGALTHIMSSCDGRCRRHLWKARRRAPTVLTSRLR